MSRDINQYHKTGFSYSGGQLKQYIGIGIARYPY